MPRYFPDTFLMRQLLEYLLMGMIEDIFQKTDRELSTTARSLTRDTFLFSGGTIHKTEKYRVFLLREKTIGLSICIFIQKCRKGTQVIKKLEKNFQKRAIYEIMEFIIHRLSIIYSSLWT